MLNHQKFSVNSTDQSVWEATALSARIFLWYTRKVPNHPFKLRLAKFFARLFFSKGLILSNPYGAKILVNALITDYIHHTLIYTGVWEPKSLALAIKLMSNGGTFLDVGSHFGLYTCAIGVLEGVDCICVEPSPKMFINMTNNIQLNPKVKANLVHAALSALPTIKSFGIPSQGNTGTARILINEQTFDQFWLVCVTLDDILDIFNQHKIQLMKIDVEGYEMEVFKGIKWLKSYRPQNIIVECDDSLLKRTGSSLFDLLNFFSNQHYDAFTVEGNTLDVSQLSNLPESNIWFKSKF